MKKAIHDSGEAGKRRVEAAERRATQWISSEVQTNVQDEGETGDKNDQDVDQNQPLRFEEFDDEAFIFHQDTVPVESLSEEVQEFC